jgi:hypothetical protein
VILAKKGKQPTVGVKPPPRPVIRGYTLRLAGVVAIGNWP